MNKILLNASSFLLLTLIICTSCHNKRHADKIFFNGKIYKVDNNFSVAEAFAIDKGRIKDIGLNDDILDDYESTDIVDLKGAAVFPGFINVLFC